MARSASTSVRSSGTAPVCLGPSEGRCPAPSVALGPSAFPSIGVSSRLESDLPSPRPSTAPVAPSVEDALEFGGVASDDAALSGSARPSRGAVGAPQPATRSAPTNDATSCVEPPNRRSHRRGGRDGAAADIVGVWCWCAMCRISSRAVPVVGRNPSGHDLTNRPLVSALQNEGCDNGNRTALEAE